MQQPNSWPLNAPLGGPFPIPIPGRTRTRSPTVGLALNSAGTLSQTISAKVLTDGSKLVLIGKFRIPSPSARHAQQPTVRFNLQELHPMNLAEEPQPSFRGGPNIAMKIPPAEFEPTLRFYRDVVRLPQLDSYRPDTVFQFGSSLLWLDVVPDIERTEIWLELVTSDTPLAAQHLARSGVERCDSVEKLPPGFDGFWVRSPASVVHLICRADDTPLSPSPAPGQGGDSAPAPSPPSQT